MSCKQYLPSARLINESPRCTIRLFRYLRGNICCVYLSFFLTYGKISRLYFQILFIAQECGSCRDAALEGIVFVFTATVSERRSAFDTADFSCFSCAGLSVCEMNNAGFCMTRSTNEKRVVHSDALRNGKEQPVIRIIFRCGVHDSLFSLWIITLALFYLSSVFDLNLPT